MASPVRCERAIYCKMFQIIKKTIGTFWNVDMAEANIKCPLFI